MPQLASSTEYLQLASDTDGSKLYLQLASNTDGDGEEDGLDEIREAVVVALEQDIAVVAALATSNWEGIAECQAGR